jgi:Uma2 family endonuclease
MAMLDAAADAAMERNPGICMDTSSDFDVLLWEVPAATIRSPDAALFDCAPDEVRPLPASHVKVIVEVISPSSRKADKLDKMAEYADAGIPFYWLVWLSGDHVLSIDIHVLDHTLGYYRLYRTVTPEQETSTIEVPIRIEIDWARLTRLVRT